MPNINPREFGEGANHARLTWSLIEHKRALFHNLDTDLETFATHDMGPVFEQAMPNLVDAAKHVAAAELFHNSKHYLKAASHLYAAHGLYKDMSDIIHQHFKNTPIDVSIRSRSKNAKIHAGMYYELAHKYDNSDDDRGYEEWR